MQNKQAQSTAAHTSITSRKEETAVTFKFVLECQREFFIWLSPKHSSALFTFQEKRRRERGGGIDAVTVHINSPNVESEIRF